MNFIRSHLPYREVVGDGSNAGSESDPGPTMYLYPGQVEEATQYMQFNGAIDLSELTFDAFPYPDSDGDDDFGVESFLDIAVFPVSEYCNSRSCNLSEYGVGMETYFNGMPFLNLCQGSRLLLDHSKFKGLYASLMVPMEGPMPSHIKNGKFPVPEKNLKYEVVIANCNQKGRRVSLSGQIVFENNEDSPVHLGVASEVKLTLVALTVCVVFSLISIRVRRGTLADHNYQLVNPDENPSDSQPAQQAQSNNGQEGNEQSSPLQEATIV